MTHLSALVLDEAAAGLTLANEAREHLETCAECQARKAAVVEANHAFLASGASHRHLDGLLPKRSPWVVVSAIAVPLAAALALFLLPHPSDETRLKGGRSLELLDRSGRVVHSAKPGDQLDLAVGGGGASAAAIFAIDQAGTVTSLYSGPLRGKALEKVARLTVTPGSVSVLAVFGSPPVDRPTVERALASASPLPDSLRLDLEVR
jgi:hypothetical protein